MAQEQQIGSNPPVQNFLDKLDEEKLKHKEHRHEFVKQKLMYIIGLFSLGSLNAGDQINLSVLLYFVPFVALAYDVFIFSEDFKVKRIGIYVRTQESFNASDEAAWEKWLNEKPKHREQMALFASIGLTLITMALSSFLLRPRNQSDNIYLFVWWFAACFVLSLLVFGLSLYRRSQLLADYRVGE
jgi:hypothetical protein